MDVNEKMFYRLRPDGQKIKAALEAGPSGFAVAKLGLDTIETTTPNIILGIVLKRPAAAAAAKKPAAAAHSEEEQEEEEEDAIDPPADGEEAEEESKEQDEEEQEEEDTKEEPEQKQVGAAGGQCVDGVWFPPGWKVDERVRSLGKQAGHSYKHYISPEGKVFRSLKAAKAFWQELE